MNLKLPANSISQNTYQKTTIPQPLQEQTLSRKIQPSPLTFEGNTPPDAPEKNNLKSKKFNPLEFKRPTPHKTLMRVLGPINRLVNLHGIPGLRYIPILNKIPGVQGITRITKIDFPKSELAKLKTAVNPNTAAFIGPNHPEYFTDWMIDKEISYQVAPYMASWATHTVVNAMGKTLQKFWLRNNLIAQIPGASEKDGKNEGKDYSIEYAMTGNGVLLHPEGTVHWTGDKVHKLFPGIVEMAVKANQLLQEKKENRPVFIAPVVWKLNFTKNVAHGLKAEIREIEGKLHLPSPKHPSLAESFVTLQLNVFKQQAKVFGYEPNTPVDGLNFFIQQENFKKFLVQQLEKTYGKQHENEEKNIYLLGKAIRGVKANHPEQYKQDNDIHREIGRLSSFVKEVYNTPHLTQEQIAESLKRMKQELLEGGYRDEVQKKIPRPVGDRTAHIRVVDPINVSALLGNKTQLTEAEQTELITQIQGKMQEKIDAINAEIAPIVKKHQVINPFYVASPQ
ncbi:MAG: hypothetical protein K2X66_09740 [Cyanobacteria bacterium]|nr:hypothetical protein [Cyanobacteriota bacterium]